MSGAGVWTDSTSRFLFTLTTDGDNKIQILRSPTNNRIDFNYKAGGTTEQLVKTGLSETTWQHIAFNWDKAGDGWTVYINGVAETPVTIAGTWVGALAAATIAIGAIGTAGNTVWDGYMSHWAVWSAPLTAGQIATLATAI